MTKESMYKSCKRAVDRWGKGQVNICMEECAELIQALSKWYRDEPDLENIAEEMADVKIMLMQMEIFFGNAKDVEQMLEFKQQRIDYLTEKWREDDE